MIRLGDLDGPGALPGPIRKVIRREDGAYYLLPYQGYEVLRFASDGTALEPLGREGQGPGESLFVIHIEFISDSLLSFDPANGRMTLFDENYEVVEISALPGQVADAGVLPDGSIVVNALMRTDEHFGIPLHHLSPLGERLSSFGGPGMVRADAPMMWMRNIAIEGGDVWSSFDNQYVIERWSTDGELLQTVQRDTDWFRPYLRLHWGGPDDPVDPSLRDLVVDDRGYLRTLVLRASPRWAELLPPKIPGTGGMIHPIVTGIGLLESVVEIIDPTTGRLFAAGVLETELYGFVDATHVFSYHEDDIGNPYVEIWRLRLSQN